MTPESIAKIICREIGISLDDLKGNRGTRIVTTARAIWWELNRKSLTKQQGAKFLNRERTTVYNFEKFHSDAIWCVDEYKDLFNRVNDIVSAIEQRLQKNRKVKKCQPCIISCPQPMPV